MIIITGITRLPILEGEVSHVEIPRTSASLGVTIVGGADTPLRCVVVQVSCDWLTWPSAER